ncbi:hypothetical protein H0H81_004685 [Sphagnurus paluster]|uniref:DUF590-domain-containing protein n=1 Tax=Sphagnurus paluster TaxID=117069 RepID=A0A9P7KJD7_9AGAR|nr:hypothetical protein H0H81_004685 [Sphagnurus paluster]
MPPEVDLVITFRATKKTSLSKQQIREDSRKAEQEYSRLIETLNYAGLRAVGRRGESLGHLLVHSDFLSGLPTTPLAGRGDSISLTPADRIRLVHAYVTSIPSDGGLGIIPSSPDWDLVESVMTLHDREFNEAWNRNWTLREIASVELEKIRGQARHSLRLVFVWSVVFVEWWRVRERILSLRFGTRGSFRVEKCRPDHKPGLAWWKRELRILASLPVLILFAGILIALLTGIFLLEAFVTKLYTGPGMKYIGFSPTILFAALIPRFLALYQSLAQRMTVWENHAHYSTHAASLTLKTFALSALVAYMGLGLSAFVYVPFGESVMGFLQAWIFQETTSGHFMGNKTAVASADGDTKSASPPGGFWNFDKATARQRLNPGLLKDQMFAYTVTNQVVNTFQEVGLPYVFRAITSFRNRRKAVSNHETTVVVKNGVKKRVVFEDEKEKGGLEEREYLDRVRSEVALPDYDVFEDYGEMVTQFGYVALWSTIWPLAPVMALLNNFLEIRSDAFKMTVHNRRPIPTRTDTIGPWLDAMTFLTWLSALTNSALVYLFCPRTEDRCSGKNMSHVNKVLFKASGEQPADGSLVATKELLLTAFLIALVASHGYILLRTLVRHLVERIVWTGSEEVKEQEREDRDIKETFLSGFITDDSRKSNGSDSLPGSEVATEAPDGTTDSGVVLDFWDNDEGLEEISRVSKEL